MMIGLDALTVGSLLILAAGGQPNPCAPPGPAEIVITPVTRDIRYDFTQNMDAIQSVPIATVNPYDFHGVSMTQGFMKGAIRIEPKVYLRHRTIGGQSAACLWYEKIEINIEIDPEIVIAKEVYDDRCMRQAVIDHEMKHIQVDRDVVNKYAAIMGKKVYEELKQRGFSVGPVPPLNVEPIAERMQKTVYQIVEHEYKKMDLERAELQAAIDTREEYDRVSALCPDFKNTMRSVLEQGDRKRR